MYSPPDYSDPRVLRDLLKSIQRAKEKVDSGDFKSLIVCGDFYIPKVYWVETGCWVNQGGQEEEDFLNGCDDYFMTQVISRSTFGPNGMGENILDLVLTSDPERILEVDYGPLLGNVKIGHAIINITYGIKVENEENSNLYKIVVSKANFQGMRDEMNKVNWDSILNGLGIEEAYSRFLCVYNNLCKENVPIKGNTHRQKNEEN